MMQEIEDLRRYETACLETFRKIEAMEKEKRRDAVYPSLVEIMAMQRSRLKWIDEFDKELHPEIKKRIELVKNYEIKK